MDEVRSKYRGYSIHIERSWSGQIPYHLARVSGVAHPRTELQFLFDASNEEAIGEAQTRIDALLEI